MQQPQTANQVLRMYAPKTARFIEERNLNARTILLYLFSQLHKSPNSEEFAKTLSNTHVKILLFPRLFALYCGIGGVLSSFFFTFITKKMSLKDKSLILFKDFSWVPIGFPSQEPPMKRTLFCVLNKILELLQISNSRVFQKWPWSP